MINLNKKITGIFKMKNLFTKNYWVMKGLALLVLVVMGGSVKGQIQLSEGFENGLPIGYSTTTSYTLGSGTWTGAANLVMQGSTGVNSGSYSLQLKSATAAQVTSPNIPVGGVSTVTFYGSASTTGSVQVNYSTDAGATWTAATGSPFSLTTTTTQKTATINSISSNILVQFYRTGAAVYIDDIVINSSEPTTQASAINFSSVAATSMTVGWTNGNGGRRAVFMKAVSGAITNPTDGTAYTASSNWSSKGTQLGTSGYYCIYNGTGNSVSLTNLSTSTAYYFQVFEYNCNNNTTPTATSINYFTSTATSNPNNQSTTSSTSAPTVTSSAASSLATTSAILNGNVTSDGGATVTERGFVYKTTSGATISDNKTIVAGTTGAYTLTPTLLVNTQYFFKAYAINSVNTTLSTPELSFYTLANAPNAPTVNNPTTTTLDVTIGASDGNPSATEYAIQETGSNNYIQANGTLSNTAVWQIASTWGTKTVTSLAPNTNYIFKVKARNGANTETAFGTTANNTTTTSPTLTTPTANTITATSATLGATISSDGGASISARGTSFKTSTPVIASDNQLAEGGTTVASYSHSRTSLSPQTLYYYAGYATNSAGTSLSAESNFRTLSSPPTAQSSGVIATVISNTQINLAISPATFPNSGATSGGYVVIYSTGTPTLSSTNATIPAAGVGTIFVTSATTLSTTQPRTSINVTGLSAGTSYNFLIVPYTYDGTNAATYNYLTTSAPTVTVTTLTTATNFYSKSTGNLDDVANWGTSTDGTGTAPSNFTTSNQYFNVRNNTSPTISSDWSISGINTKVIVDATIVLTIPITKSFTIGVGATLENNGTITITNNGTLTIKSDATGTARIGTSTGTITGNVTIERYIPATRRAYRFLAAPVTTTGGIYANWQESGTNATGLGIQVTGFASATPGVDATSGLDKSLTGSSSMFTYNGSAWVAVDNTNTTQLTPGKGFRVLVRGDREYDLYANTPPAATATTIKATGAVGQGTITLNSLVTGFNLLGNPYPSAIDWDASGWGTARNATNVYDAIYIYNPALTASTSSMTYPTYLNGVGTNGGSNIIHSGQAFFVEAAAGASISFLEAYKSSTVTGGFFRSALPEMMRVTYMQNNEHLDDIVIRYNDDAQADFDPKFDAISMGGDANGLASFKNADRLAIHTRPTAVGEDSVALSVRNTTTGNYQLKFSEMEGFAASTDITLLDKFLNVQYDVKQDSIVNFEITTDVNSKGDDRFWLFYNHKSTGINLQALAKNKINVYPNPASSVINMSLKLQANQKSTYTYNIYNQLGAMVQAGEVAFANGKQAQINIDAFSPGVYFISASNGNDLQTIKFVK